MYVRVISCMLSTEIDTFEMQFVDRRPPERIIGQVKYTANLELILDEEAAESLSRWMASQDPRWRGFNERNQAVQEELGWAGNLANLVGGPDDMYRPRHGQRRLGGPPQGDGGDEPIGSDD